MDDLKSKSINQMLKDLRSDPDPYRRSYNSSGLSLRQDSRLSTASNNEDNLVETPKRQRLEESSYGKLAPSEGQNIPGSPWEWNRMKAEIIALKTRLSQQESTVQQLHKVRREIEEVFQKEKKILEIQVEQDKQLIKQLELRLDVNRRTIQDCKSAQAKAEHDLIQMKSKLEQKIIALVDDNNKLTDELRRHVKQEAKSEASYTKTPDNKDLEEKFEKASKRIVELEEKLKESRSAQQKFEVQNVEVQNLKMKIERLESERSMSDEGKNFMQRAAKANEYEKELIHAREIIASLRESVKGKLLIEEQMATMQHRLERTEKLERQITQLEINQSELLAKISAYESIGIAGGPSAIKREIGRLQQSEILLTAEEGQLRSQLSAVQRELVNTQQKVKETQTILSDVTTSNERLTRFVTRLQKKLSLVTRERDSYRQQLDMYESEITGMQSQENPNLLNERIPALERAIEGYRELVAKLESDLEAIDGKGQREEMKRLREENDRLQGEIEHRDLKGDFNINSRILHYKYNPAALAEQLAEEKQNALVDEVKKLRAIVSSGNHSGTVPVSALQNQEMAELQQKHELKITRLKEAFKASSHEYRQACYQLFGWRVDRTKEGHYKLSSQYAESPDDYLFFIVKEDGVNMIETPFSANLNDFIERHLKLQHSVPMFLNAVQTDLFEQQTATNVLN